MQNRKNYTNRRSSGAPNRGFGRKSRFSSNGRRSSNWQKNPGSQGDRYSQKISRALYISRGVENVLEDVYIAEKGFGDFNFSPVLLQNIIDRKYAQPTKIQDQAIPHILAGKDVIGIGNTGSGKTGAFLIPLIDKVLRNPTNKVLILTPTRELATQINNEFRLFTKNTNLRMTLVIGGERMGNQISHLKSGSQFVVATPGRLMDLEERRCILLGTYNNIVLDEVDQMLDMGFVIAIKSIISKLASQKQSLFFSATMSYKEEAIANSLVNSPIKIVVNKEESIKSIHQDIVKVNSNGHKLQVLYELLMQEEFNKVLIFSKTKRGADQISAELSRKGIMIDALHGNKSQNVRAKVMNKFRRAEISVLVATDVAARGIDIPDVSHVINYDEPATYNDYIHRIGRTGRAGKPGKALTFVIG